MGRYLVKLNDLEEKNNFLNDKISSIRESVSNIKALKNDICWESPSEKDFFKKYEEYIDELNNMLVNLEKALQVTKKYHENYTSGYNKITKNLKKLSEKTEMN